MDIILDSLRQYYGLDWVAFAAGMYGMWLLTQQNRWGFFFNAIACMSALIVACISLQFGFLVYNTLLIFMMVRGFVRWTRPDAAAKNAAPRPRL
jgi:hypothetical protein